jgi:Xaa-Pro aminopeptidase
MGQVSAPWPAADMSARLAKARELMAAAGCEALLVTGLANVRYLSGFSGSAGMLFVRPEDAVLVTDGRYATQAPAELGRCRAPVAVEALPAHEQAGLLAKLASPFSAVGLEAAHLSWARQRRLREEWPAATDMVPTEGLVEGLRAVKDEAELARLKAAAHAASAALAAIAPSLAEGPAELEVAAELEAELRRQAPEGAAFEPIVAAGPCAAEPHHRPCERRVKEGELVVVDFGARVEGYCSDMTRALWAGGPGALRPELRRVAAVVLASQDAGLSAVAAGATGKEVDRACREVVEAAGLGKYFVHGTGHGVGLEVHEAPSLGLVSEDILRPGQVVTVEPGVYLPGLGGARSEDMVFVTEAGCELLTLAPKLLP